MRLLLCPPVCDNVLSGTLLSVCEKQTEQTTENNNNKIIIKKSIGMFLSITLIKHGWDTK